MNDIRAKLVHANTARQEWVPTSKTGQVNRRRVFRLGGPESGRVTSVVRYEPGSNFPAHPHPQGEEILVLEGVFSDWRGDHAAGTFLLNPEGFEHAPRSEPGCLLFVRLRQFPGQDRPQKALPTADLPWDDLGRKVLMDGSFDDRQYLQLLDRERTFAVPPEGMEVFVVSGTAKATLPDGEVLDLELHDWVRCPDEGTVTVRAQGDAETVLLVKENTLRSAFAPLP